MRRSRMEAHLEILKVLAQKRAIKLTELMYETNTSCSVLREHIKFLIRKQCITEQTHKNKTIVYDISEKRPDGAQTLQRPRNHPVHKQNTDCKNSNRTLKGLPSACILPPS